MGLNKQKGNMYGFVTHTWNPIKGRCIHNCTYCYMRRIWDRMDDMDNPNNSGATLRLDEKELNVNLGEGNFIFVGSSTDIWAENIPADWIMQVLRHTRKYQKNTYLFQTKNPKRFDGWIWNNNDILGITLETESRMDKTLSSAPNPEPRSRDFSRINHYRKMVTIEPILVFHLEPLVEMIKEISPEWVNVGADSGGNKLPEPNKEEILALIDELNKFTVVKNKTNLKRLLK